MFKLHTILLWGSLFLFSLPTSADSTDSYCEQVHRGAVKNSDNYVVLIDTSYKNTIESGTILYEGLNSVLAELESFDRLTVKTMDAVGVDGSLLFDRCLPACPDPSWLDQWGLGDCDTMQVRKDKLKFKKVLMTRSVPSLDNPTFPKVTPDLINTLSSVGRQYKHPNVILFSYMNHHDREHQPIASEDFDKLFFDLVTNERVPGLEGRRITIFGIPRADSQGQINLVELRQFWQDLFELSGADLIGFGQRYQ